MFVMGLDIGYSNLKIAMGEKGGDIATKILPAGAGSVDLLPQKVGGGGNDDCILVDIDGEKWAAGVEPERLQGWERELHRDYSSTKVYKALFYAALLLSDRKAIDLLVTGLPVDQALDQVQRKLLVERLIGEHRITPKRTVTVKDVLVVPQPAGAYMDIIHSVQDPGIIEVIQNGKTVVIDPGFYSVDWVALIEGEIHYHSSGTSLKAMSRLIQVANDLIRDDHGSGPGVEKIEKAIRAGRKSVYLFGEKVDLQEYLQNASAGISREALTAMRKTMRDDGMNADVVLLAGGGANDYGEAARELFPKSRILQADDSVLANARGFVRCA